MLRKTSFKSLVFYCGFPMLADINFFRYGLKQNAEKNYIRERSLIDSLRYLPFNFDI